ncbi:MAG: twin-arginine translocase subunit TatC [Nitrospirae bacterium]|nr:twin-arginine translocase subunit TatC [Nitrospirota bacterium]NTW66770.1 twin-arginine translocase subunit TatC [Nitrospirota bacterium]
MPTANPEESKMSFWSHLDELRKRIVNVAIAVGIGFVLCFAYSEEILGLLLLPMNATVAFSLHFPFVAFTPNKTVQTLHFTALTEPFMSHLKIGFIAGIMLMVPVLLRQVWLFIAPGLLPRERKYAGQFVFFATIFFAVGVLFCFFILLPIAVPFLISYKAEHLTPIIKIGDYIDFTLKFMLATGAVFELPLIMILLGRMGIISVDSLTKFRKYALLIAFIIGGIVTPTPDAFNMTIMSIPIYLLYEIGILGVRILGRKKDPDSTSLTEI